MKPVIVVQSVKKKYSRNSNQHLNYGMMDLLRECFGRAQDTALRKDEFYAVNDISFFMNQGDSLAFIGRNGSGKTTLLKLMHGLIKLNAGTILMTGRVQALINLGAGFNPSLSGIDNIRNAAAGMGLNRKETESIVDKVIDFSELEEFIETPVGNYSSGMASRLGFAVAINLNPDILLIDEILAVGDFAFQNKCFIKMHELKKSGVTIVLVSHSHTNVIQLCERAIWLHKGVAVKMGEAKETVQAYLDFLGEEEKARVQRLTDLKSQNAADIERKAAKTSESLYGPIHDEFDMVKDLEVTFHSGGAKVDSVRLHDELIIDYKFTLAQPVTDLNVTLCFFTKAGIKMNSLSTLNGNILKDINSGEVHCRVRIDDFNLNPGTYVLIMPIHEGKSYLYRDIVKEFVVESDGRLTWEMVDFKYEYSVESSTRKPKQVSYM